MIFTGIGSGQRRMVGPARTLAIGAAVGRVVSTINARGDDPATAPIVVLAGTYLAFLPAEALHVSAILAAGAAGRVVGMRSPKVDRPNTRPTGYAFWDTWVFLLTAVLFALVGLQLPVILDALDDQPVSSLTGAAAAVIAAVVLVRIVTVFGLAATPATGRRFRLDGRPRPWAEA